MLAGIGSGRTALQISPRSETARMIKNCFKYFIGIPQYNLKVLTHYTLCFERNKGVYINSHKEHNSRKSPFFRHNCIVESKKDM